MSRRRRTRSLGNVGRRPLAADLNITQLKDPNCAEGKISASNLAFLARFIFEKRILKQTTTGHSKLNAKMRLLPKSATPQTLELNKLFSRGSLGKKVITV